MISHLKLFILGIVKLQFFEYYDNIFITFEDACRVTIVSDMQRMADQGMSLHTEIYIPKKCNLVRHCMGPFKKNKTNISGFFKRFEVIMQPPQCFPHF